MDRDTTFWFWARSSDGRIMFSVIAEDDVLAWQLAQRVCRIRGYVDLEFCDQEVAREIVNS